MSNSSRTTLLDSKQVKLLKNFEHTSTQVRYLNSLGLTNPEIRKELIKIGKTKRPQHIRNILTTPVANPTETWEE